MRAILRYERTEFGKAVRGDYEGKRISLRRNEIRMLQPRTDGICNTLTGVEKDNLLYEDI